MMKLLITGATGFLGSHLTKELVNQEHEVIILKRSFSNTWRINEILSKVTVFDIDQISLEQPFVDCESIDAVVHTATKYDRNGEKLSTLLDANVSFPLKLLEASISHKVKIFINTDSFIHKNNAGYKHLAGYALTKKQFLEWGKELSKLEKIHFLNIQLEHLYGPFDADSKFSKYILKSFANNVPALNLTPGEQKRDFIHVNDAVSAYSQILKQKPTDFPYYKEFELGTGKTATIREFVELIHQKVNSQTTLKFGAIPYREKELMESCANNRELRNLGWKSEIELEKGIEMMIGDESI